MFREKLPMSNAALTFRDVVLVPGKAKARPIDVDLSTKVSINNRIGIPLVSSPMDTVTEHELAIGLARLGGVGVVHRNMSTEEEVEEVRKVKEAPPYPMSRIYVEPELTTKEALDVLLSNNLDAVPVVSEGKVLGIVRRRNLISLGEGRVSDVIEESLTIDLGTDEDHLVRIMRKLGVDSVALVNREGNYVGTVVLYDLESKVAEVSKDKEGRLLVGAAVSPFDLDRAVKLSRYADFLVIDVAHVDDEAALTSLRKMIDVVNVDVVIGNLGTYEGAVDVITRLDRIGGLRVGIGSGSICSTGVVTGVASPTLWAVAHVADAALDYGLRDTPIIADGGIREPGDVVKAMAVGAWCSMMGRVFAQCKESPSPLIRIGDRYYKYYRGMASSGARARRFAIDRYGTRIKNVEEGVEGLVPYRGTLRDVVKEFVGGTQASMSYIGVSNVKEARELGKLLLVTSLGKSEIDPHHVIFNH